MTRLSVNVNKIATLRNTRALDIPSLTTCCQLAIDAGAHGITIHPRPDQRHIRASDVPKVATVVREHPGIELNIEGNPFEGDFLRHCETVRPDQCTLVPDAPGQSTSDHGWDVLGNRRRLEEVIARLRRIGCRVSLFLDADVGPDQFQAAKDVGADRVELYTEPYARAFAAGEDRPWRAYQQAADLASRAGLAINAGHDLNRANLRPLLQHVPGIIEVSIGHALIADAVIYGLAETVRLYLAEIPVENR
jgi:pyridoxine 5-phosphate synthase